jgi:hypothetical protein
MAFEEGENSTGGVGAGCGESDVLAGVSELEDQQEGEEYESGECYIHLVYQLPTHLQDPIWLPGWTRCGT